MAINLIKQDNLKRSTVTGADRKEYLERVAGKCVSEDEIFFLQLEDRDQPCQYVWQEISGRNVAERSVWLDSNDGGRVQWTRSEM